MAFLNSSPLDTTQVLLYYSIDGVTDLSLYERDKKKRQQNNLTACAKKKETSSRKCSHLLDEVVDLGDGLVSVGPETVVALTDLLSLGVVCVFGGGGEGDMGFARTRWITRSVCGVIYGEAS